MRHHRDFDARVLASVKDETTVSVCLPARNEAETVGPIVEAIRSELVEGAGLVDQLLVIDDNSTDGTAAAARRAGAEVLAVEEILAELPGGAGKGEAMWKSMFASDGDLVCWIDADIRNFEPHFVIGLLGPLLEDDAVAFTKGCYRRPLGDDPQGGGRVTELLVRPVLSQFFPELTGVVQPLAGEFAGRRTVLERVPFAEGYGVDVGLLIDVTRLAGLDALVQVDLGVREHRNRPLTDLGPQAMAVLVTVLRRAGVAPSGSIAALRRFDAGGAEEVVAVETRERPPMSTIAQYRKRFGRELSA
jgi:glucosyl-3-phosphoglycerate synthase